MSQWETMNVKQRRRMQLRIKIYRDTHDYSSGKKIAWTWKNVSTLMGAREKGVMQKDIARKLKTSVRSVQNAAEKISLIGRIEGRFNSRGYAKYWKYTTNDLRTILKGSKRSKSKKKQLQKGEGLSKNLKNGSNKMASKDKRKREVKKPKKEKPKN